MAVLESRNLSRFCLMASFFADRKTQVYSSSMSQHQNIKTFKHQKHQHHSKSQWCMQCHRRLFINIFVDFVLGLDWRALGVCDVTSVDVMVRVWSVGWSGGLMSEQECGCSLIILLYPGIAHVHPNSTWCVSQFSLLFSSRRRCEALGTLASILLLLLPFIPSSLSSSSSVWTASH